MWTFENAIGEYGSAIAALRALDANKSLEYYVDVTVHSQLLRRAILEISGQKESDNR